MEESSAEGRASICRAYPFSKSVHIPAEHMLNFFCKRALEVAGEYLPT